MIFGTSVDRAPTPWLSSRSKIGHGCIASLVVLSLVGCAEKGPVKPTCVPGTHAATGTRGELNKGYSLLYQEAQGLGKVRFLLKVKEQPSDVETVATAITDEYLKLQDRMEALAKDYPALKLDAADVMSNVVADTRKAIGTDQFKSFAPLVGDSGVVYERNLLLLFEGATNEQVHLTQVLADSEPDPGLKQFDLDETARLTALHTRVISLLDRHYFKG